MKKILIHPLFAPVFAFAVIMIALIWGWHQTAQYLDSFIDWELEIITYTCYGIGLLVMLCVIRDYKTTYQKQSYYAMMVLWLAALLREAGIQHWLTSTDTTAIKLRFFTNPNNPLHEKIVTALIVTAVMAVIAFLLYRYFVKIFKGVWNLDPIYWTVATFGGALLMAKFVDRFPSHYRKSGGELSDFWFYYIELLEETTEALLPILLAVGLIQYHLMQKKD